MEFNNEYESIATRLLQNSLEAEDGYTDETITTAVQTTGVEIPQALREYYTVLGAHSLNQIHNRLRPPNGLKLDDEEEYVIFMRENQDVCVWGYKVSQQKEVNPVAFQGIPDDEHWVSEQVSLCEFLVINFYINCMSGLAFSGTNMNPNEVLEKIENDWPKVVDHNGMIIWEKDAMLIQNMGFPWVVGAANTQESYDVLISDFGFE